MPGDAIEELIFNLESSIEQNRLQAILASVRFSDPRIIAALNNVAANDENVELRYHARRAVHQIKDRLKNELSQQAPGGQSVTEGLPTLLRHPDAEVRAKAILAMAASELPDKENVLRETAQKEKDPVVKAAIARASVVLGRHGIPILVAMLQDSDPRVKANAVEAIEGIGDQDSYMHIVPLLGDVDNRVRANVGQALQRFGKANLVRTLERMLDSEKVAYRDSAVYALGVARMPEAVPLLIKATKDIAESVRLKAVRGLEVLSQAGVKEAKEALDRYRSAGGAGEQTVEISVGDLFREAPKEDIAGTDLLYDENPENRITELKRIAKLRAYERVQEVAKLLATEQDDQVKATILVTLGQLKAKKYDQMVKGFLREDNPRLRANAVEALAAFEDPSYWQEIVPLLDDDNNRVRANAIVALKACPDVDLDSHLRQMLGGESLPAKKSALYAIMEMRDERHFNLFMQVLDDSYEEIRQTALEDIVLLKSEGFTMAEQLYAEALRRGLKPPEQAVIRERRDKGSKKVITLTKEIDRLLVKMVEKGASDLHISSNHRPQIRKDGDIIPLEGFNKQDDATLTRYLMAIMPERNKTEFQQISDTDFAYDLAEVARFRVNVFSDLNGVGAVFRQLPSRIPSVEKLNLPKEVVNLCFLPKGLVLVTGPTGSGKSTTLAGLINYINMHRSDHIITIEDPVEFVHTSRKCLVNQREVFTHTESFKRALRAALREDPDIVLLGEMRDLDTTRIALETAETGHLVFATVHTNSAASTVDRVIGQFPNEEQEQIRVMLSETLKAVITQTLCKRVGGGRVAALEVMIVNTAISNLIREGKTYQIPSIIQTTRHMGNMTLNDWLLDLVKKGSIDANEAYMKAYDKITFLDTCGRVGVQISLPTDDIKDQSGSAATRLKQPSRGYDVREPSIGGLSTSPGKVKPPVKI